MKLYLEGTNEKGKRVGIGSNERLEATVYEGNKKMYSVYIECGDIGDIIDDDGNELPESEKTKGATVTTREWRNQPDERRIRKGNKLQGEKCEAVFCKSKARYTIKHDESGDLFTACETHKRAGQVVETL